MEVNLSVNARLSPKIALLYNEIALEVRQEFTNFIDELSQPHKENLDWWVAGPASRNTLASPLFHYYCSIKLLERLLQKQAKIEKVVVDSVAFYNMVTTLFSIKKNEVNVILSISFKKRIKTKLGPFARFINEAFISLQNTYFARRSRQQQNEQKKHKIKVLVDTFVYPGAIDQDRTYTGLWEKLSKKEQEELHFVPNLHSFNRKSLLKAYQELRTSERSFLLKEDFLHFSDYCYALGHITRSKKLKIPITKYCGIDFSPLVREELQSFTGFTSSVLGLLNYRFAKRLQEKGVTLKRVINRFENQVIDKGWNKGFKQFHPNATTIGYQGFVMSTHYLCMYPTRIEDQSGVLPSQIAVIGKGHIASKQEFYSGVKLITAPALRFSGVWKAPKYVPKVDAFTILVALPINLADCHSTLSLIVQTLTLIPNSVKNMKFWIKPHPTISTEAIRNVCGTEWTELFEFVSGDFNECVEKSNLFLGNLSSTCLETLAKGIPVIVVGNPNGLTHNPIPTTITEDIWQLSRTPEELAGAIEYYYKCSPEKIKHFKDVGKDIRGTYFEPVTSEGIKKLLYDECNNIN